VGLAGGFDNARQVRTEIRVRTRYLKEIPEDSQTAISSDTLVSEKFIAISQGKSAVPVREGGVLPGEPVVEAANRANQIEALHQDLARLDQILADLSSPNSQNGQLFQGSDIYNSTLAGMDVFHRTLHSVTNPEGDLGKAFYTLEIYDRMEKFIRSVDQSLTEVQNGRGTLGHAFASDEQYNAAVSAIKDLRSSLADANAGKGGWGAWLQDDSNYTQFVRVLTTASRSVDEINHGEGKASQLLANAQLYDSLSGSLRQMEAMLRDMRENPRKYLRVHPFRKNPMEAHRRAVKATR
jgi:phospholipid/cholesterol/gamma-HCH transport system substrate-binding protein